MQKIGLLGAGVMGSGIAQAFALYGYKVIIRDISKESIEKSQYSIDKGLSKLIDSGKILDARKIEIINSIVYTENIEDLKECDLVIEAATENREIKKQLFQQLDAICLEHTIFASNTSSLSITEVASMTKRPEKVLGMHFFNPVPVMKLVEVIKGVATDEAIKNQVMLLATLIGKTPIEVEETPGFVVNRILVPMINEAIGVLGDGVATKEAIDAAMKLGANHPIGPLSLGDLIGLDVCLAIMEVLYEEYGDSKYRPHPLLRKMVRGNRLGRKTGEGFFKYG